MTKTIDQQGLLDHIWLDLHEKQGKSAEAARLAHQSRAEFSDNPEMSGELAAMEMVAAGAAAKDTQTFAEAYPLFLQSAQVVLDTFPLSDDEEEARQRGNNWDTVYGDLSAQLKVLHDYLRLIMRLTTILQDSEFKTYATNLQNFLSQHENELSPEKNDQKKEAELQKKLSLWSQEAHTHDLTVLKKIPTLTWIGLGHDTVVSLRKTSSRM